MTYSAQHAAEEAHEWIDVEALTRRSEPLAGSFPLARLARVVADAPALSDIEQGVIRWQVHAQWRDPDPAVAAALRALAGGERGAVPRQLWLHLRAEGAVPLICQRCLEPFWQPLSLARWFRFVADEATAAAEDESCEEDLLVLDGPRYHLLELVEDELLLAAPMIPMHDVCPRPLPLVAGVALGQAMPDHAATGPKRPNPFSALAALKSRRS